MDRVLTNPCPTLAAFPVVYVLVGRRPIGALATFATDVALCSLILYGHYGTNRFRRPQVNIHLHVCSEWFIGWQQIGSKLLCLLVSIVLGSILCRFVRASLCAVEQFKHRFNRLVILHVESRI